MDDQAGSEALLGDLLKTYIGIDNGVTGSIGIIDVFADYKGMPVFSQQSYTKKKQNITRVDTEALRLILLPYSVKPHDTLVVIERPFVNPSGFKSTLSAIRCLEATLIVVETLGLPYMYIDSREWQKAMLPSGLKGIELKHASRDIGIRLFPHLKEAIITQKDSDALLIGEYARRSNL